MNVAEALLVPSAVCPRAAVLTMKTTPRAKETARRKLRITSWLLFVVVGDLGEVLSE